MCTTNVFTYVYPDGRRVPVPQLALCPSSRYGLPCPKHVTIQHPRAVPQYSTPMPFPAYGGNLPPSPAYSPRPSASSHRSGDESDRSYNSSSSKRRSGVYVNGQRVTDTGRRDGQSRRERIILVDNPPTPRTPPQTYQAPHTAPPSPNTNLSVPYSSSPRESSLKKPYIVDERPRVHIELVGGSNRQSRHPSSSSRDSHASAEDEERRRLRRERREQREQEKQREEAAIREKRIRDRINKANAEISSRPVRVNTAPQRSSTYVERRSRRDRHDDLVSAVQNMSLDEKQWKEKLAREKALRLQREEEEEAQRQRLKERMMPRRRATVGPGARRQRVLYDDGIYRWE